MKIINWPRQSGKTTTLLKSLGPEGVILVADERRREMLIEMAKKLELDISAEQIVTVDRVKSVRHRWVSIDDLDRVLPRLVRAPVDAVTMTSRAVPPPWRPAPSEHDLARLVRDISREELIGKIAQEIQSATKLDAVELVTAALAGVEFAGGIQLDVGPINDPFISEQFKDGNER